MKLAQAQVTECLILISAHAHTVTRDYVTLTFAVPVKSDSVPPALYKSNLKFKFLIDRLFKIKNFNFFYRYDGDSVMAESYVCIGCFSSRGTRLN